MTQEEILKMPAGREMDALIFEHVFGFEKGSFPVHEPMKSKLGDYMVRPIQQYSSDISAAFEVAEKLSDKWDFALMNNQNFRKYPDLHYGFRLQAIGEDNHIKTIFALGETAPLAICRAALLIFIPDEKQIR
jgi:hypothetical protein